MKHFALVALALVAAVLSGCGQAGGSPAAEPVASTQQVPKPEPPIEGPHPPDVVLVSEAGRQTGVVGSYCVNDDAAGLGICADGPRPSPEQATIVRPGDSVTIALEGARAVKAAGCRSRDTSCVGEIVVSPAGCGAATAARVRLKRGSELQWRVNLAPGAYELQLFFYFDSEDGRSGDSSAALGLVVEPGAEPAIVPMPAAAAVCP